MNGVVICDSQSALQAISSPQSTCHGLVQKILHQLVLTHEKSLIIRFLWIPSHVGIAANDTVDHLAKNACRQPPPDDAISSLRCFKKMIYKAAVVPTHHRRNAERHSSVSIKHYDLFRQTPPPPQVPSAWTSGSQAQCSNCSTSSRLPSSVGSRWGRKLSSLLRL